MPDLIDILNPAIESYNGYTFSPNTLTRLSCEPQLDRSGRVVMFHRLTFEVNSFVLAPLVDDIIDDTEDLMLDIQKKLNQRGGRLRATGLGLGNFLINDPGPVIPDNVNLYRDVANGPTPRRVAFTPLGSNKAWQMNWICVANVVQCNEGTAVDDSGERVMAFNYTWGVQINEHGFTTRVISGELVIPSTILPGVRNVPAVADIWWERVLGSIPVPTGFLRQSEHRMSEDRRTITFTITDTEKSVDAFVPGATTWEADQDADSTLQGKGFTQWTNTLTATYQVSRDRSKRELFQHFETLMQSRVNLALKPLGGAKKNSWYPLEFRVRDSITSQSVSFMFRWMLIARWDVAIEASGMWQVVPHANWERWFQSMQQTSLHPRGNARMAYNAAADAIIDLCEPPVFGNLDPIARLGNNRLANEAGGGRDSIPLARPTPDDSWVAYEAMIYYETDQGTVTLQPLPTAPFSYSGMPSQVATYLSTGNEVSGNDGFVSFDNTPQRLPRRVGAVNIPAGVVTSVTMPIPETPAARNIVQQRVVPMTRARFVGRALRVAYPINPPELVMAGGSVAVLERENFGTSFVANYGLPLVYAEWDMIYTLPDFKRGSLPIPGNPVLGL